MEERLPNDRIEAEDFLVRALFVRSQSLFTTRRNSSPRSSLLFPLATLTILFWPDGSTLATTIAAFRSCSVPGYFRMRQVYPLRPLVPCCVLTLRTASPPVFADRVLDAVRKHANVFDAAIVHRRDFDFT